MNELRERVLIYAATQRDVEATCKTLSNANVLGTKCTSLEDLIAKIEEGAGAIILAKEVLNVEVVADLSKILNSQPAWSFLPIILLISAGDLSHLSNDTQFLLKPLRNTTLLERPVRVSTLLSIVQSALGDRKRQYEVRDLVEALQVSKREAEDANQAKSSFLANMSHEIRTPLGSILGFSELMSDQNISEKERSTFVDVIKRNGQQLLTLIDDILDLAKVESGQFTIEAVDTVVSDLVLEVLVSLKPNATRKNLALVSQISADVPKRIRIDPTRLKQILMNVIGNSIKFTEKGIIKTSLTVLQPLSSGGPKRLYISIEDQGIGISEEQAAKLFKPFSQADSTITRRFGGTGLGLVLSKRLANLMNGDLRLEHSEAGKGSIFGVEIPIRPPLVPDLSDSIANFSLEPQADSLKDRRILLVDDSLDNQALIGRMLSLAGADVKLANDGYEGVEKAMAGDFDLVLMDIQMPKLGGREATESLRRSGYKKPVIALTAHALQDDQDRCIAAGCDDYLTKPIKRNELIHTIATHIL